MTTLRLALVADLSDEERAEVRALAAAVYPPEVDLPARQLEWTPATWCVRVWEADGRLVSYVGVVVREADLDGRAVRAAGIGGVKTHPDARGRGHAPQAIRRAMELFRELDGVDFGLLVCEPRLVPYYQRFGWREFGGTMIVRQRGVAEEFTFNRVMTAPVGVAGPEEGRLDLLGAPW